MTTKLQSLTTLWQEFNLTGTQKLLDDLAGQITERQDESDASRKNLIELIRSFKKNNPEEIRLTVAPLLKSFQNEVDSLSKRSKAAEKAFFDIYKKFCDIADPVPTLEYCMESLKSLHKLQDLEIENKQLRETMGTYTDELQTLKGVEKELEAANEKLAKHEVESEQELEKLLAAHREQLDAEFLERLKAIEEEKIMASQKLADSEQKMINMQKVLEECQTELYDLKSKQEGKHSAISDEVEILITDLERANQRALVAEKEAAALQERLAELQETTATYEPDPEILESEQLKVQLHAKESEVGQLVEDVQRLTRQAAEVEARHAAKAAAIEAQLVATAAQAASLEERLARQADYETVKKELAILRTLEFSSSSSSGQEGEGEDTSSNRPLEVLILERSKVLQSENSLLRLEKEKMNKEMQELKSELEVQNHQVAKQAELIVQLEDHVEQLQTISTPYREEAEGRSSSDMLAEVLLTDSPGGMVGGGGDYSSAFTKAASTSPLLNADPGNTMLGIVQAQRERLKQQKEELEVRAEQQDHQLQLLQGELHHLQQDNIKLYEKIRFLQSCSGGRTAAQRDVQVALESKYHSSYEQKLDPFASFNQEEKRRKYAQLSVFEKIILSLVRFIAGNKTARLAVFFYSILLHGLVFAVLYKLAWTESCRHDMAAKWHEKYIEHMEAVHGEEAHHDIG